MKFLIPIILSLGLSSCVHASLTIKSQTVKYTNIGMASFYGRGDGFHGHKTASGARFNANGFTAAHRTLRFGTRIRVINLRNNRSVVIVVNDRGPHKRTGRIIDLSYGAAQKIGMVNSGVAKVKLEILQ